MYHWYKTFLAAVLIIFSFSPAFTQNSVKSGTNYNGNSPYSRIGIGDMALPGSLRNVGMGSAGVSNMNPEFINSVNPALLINYKVRSYDSLLTILEGSVLGQMRKISTSTDKENNGTLNFNSFSYLFPVSKRWTTNVGLQQFSTVNYNLTQTGLVNGSTTDSANIYYSGNGGIYQAYFGNGARISRNFNIGFQVAYLFGTIHHESLSQITTLADSNIVGTDKRTSYSGFMLRPGVVYRIPLERSIHPDSSIIMSIGFSSDLFTNMVARERLDVQRKTQYNILLSQIVANSGSQDVRFPSTYRFGVSFNKYFNWNLAADFSYSNWESFDSSGDTLKNSFTIALGGEFLMNKNKFRNEQELSLKRNYLRVGLNYTKTPLYFEGKQLNDISFSIGYSRRLGNRSTYRYPLPKINLALVAGQRGTHSNNLVKDMYFKLYIGVTINDKWFRRRRVD
ncbi:MAG: hypothetical protein K2X86_01110 [Cytophagaceae bacterium]|nr:hypothetical protein [Cytophagaceae bacterium]